jgi:hypothetical protein
MENFNKKLKSYLTVYKIPIAPDSLDPTVFYFPETGELPKLLPSVHAQITNDIEMFTSGQPSRIKNYVIVGDVVTPGSKDRTKDIKVLIILNKDLLDIDVDGLLAEEILKLTNTLSGRQAHGTLRKIQYIPTLRQDFKKYNAVYDVGRYEWLKVPSAIEPK